MKNQWIVARRSGAELKCLRCGATQAVVLPMLVDAWVAASKVFLRVHRHCKERAA